MAERAARRPVPLLPDAAIRVGYLWIPHLPLVVALRRRPDLDGHPTIVADDAAGDGIVRDASDECFGAGVRMGQPLREAREFVPSAGCLPADSVAERRLHEAALDLLDDLTPAVEDDGLGRAYFVVDVSAVGGVEHFLTALRGHLLARCGVRARLAVAPGKFPARIAVEHDLRCASGTPVVLEDGVAPYLAPLPVAVLPLAPQARDRLRLLGIVTVGQFARLPRDGLTRRFGSEAALAHTLAQGRDERPVVPRRRPETRAAHYTFEPAVVAVAPLLAVADRLVTHLCRSLQADGKAFRQLVVAVEHEAGGSAERVAALRQPTTTLDPCRTTLRLLVEALATGGPVTTVGVTLAALTTANGAQLTLLDQGVVDDERRRRLDGALQEVTRRYPSRLLRATRRNLPTLLDEYQFALLPLEPGDERQAPLAEIRLATARPVEIARRGARLYLIDRGRWEELIARHRSWRADEWWPDPVRRTYWRVRTRSRRICTLAHDADGWRLVDTWD